MYPYRIRLRGPWDAEPLDPPGPVRRVTLPARLGECGLGDCRRVRFVRRFGRPRRIDEHERIWLVGEGLSGRAEFRLNGRDLGWHSGDAGPFAYHVTDSIGERNELAIDLSADEPSGGLWGDVALEIRCSAYLDEVTVRPKDGSLAVEGMIRGEASQPLDVYVLAAGRTIGYATCVAGQRFAVVTDDRPETAGEVRVELVNGAVVWYASDISV